MLSELTLDSYVIKIWIMYLETHTNIPESLTYISVKIFFKYLSKRIEKMLIILVEYHCLNYFKIDSWTFWLHTYEYKVHWSIYKTP